MTDETQTEMPGPTTTAGKVSELWLRAWQRELGPDATLTSDEQSRLHQLMRASSESTWQDISTAPLKVLVLVAQSGKKLPIMAKRYARGWAFFGAPKQDVYWLTLDEAPTHWQPLPLTSDS